MELKNLDIFLNKTIPFISKPFAEKVRSRQKKGNGFRCSHRFSLAY